MNPEAYLMLAGLRAIEQALEKPKPKEEDEEEGKDDER